MTDEERWDWLAYNAKTLEARLSQIANYAHHRGPYRVLDIEKYEETAVILRMLGERIGEVEAAMDSLERKNFEEMRRGRPKKRPA